MRLKPASDHGRSFMIRKVAVVGHNYLLVLLFIRGIEEILDIFENNMDEGVIVGDEAFRQPRKYLSHQLPCLAGILLLDEVKGEVPV